MMNVTITKDFGTGKAKAKKIERDKKCKRGKETCQYKGKRGRECGVIRTAPNR